MKVPRDRLTIAEVLSTEPEVLDKIIEFFDLSIGDAFFFSNNPDREHFVENVTLEDGEYFIHYGYGQITEYNDELLPLFSATAMLDMIKFHCQFELRSIGDGWFAIMSGSDVVYSEDGEDLVSLLWKVLKKAHLEYPI